MGLELPKGKSLSVFSLMMINIIAVDSLRSLPISAEYGLTLVFYYLVAAVIFFVPVALVAAELATGWPETGGLYVWVREAFGKRFGFVTIWLLWVYNVVWFPTILAFITSAIAYLISPSLALDKGYIFCTVIVIFWGATFLNFFGMRVSSFISMLGAIFGTLFPMLIIIVLALCWLIKGHHAEIHFSVHDFIPHINSLGDLVLLTGLLYGLVGMEMSAVHAGDVKDPQRDYPRALLFSTIIIFLSLVLASLAVSIVVPQSKLSLVTGLFDAFEIFFAAYHLAWLNPIVIGLMILGGISGVSTWVIGPTKGLMVAAEDGCLPLSLMKKNRHGAPTVVLWLQAVLFTLLSSVFVFSDSINASYWMLSALTAQLAMMVYVMMFLAAIRLRYKFPDKQRSYTIPGGNIIMVIVAGLGFLTCCFAILLGFVPPSHIKIENIAFFEGFLVSGTVIFILSAWYLPLVLGNATFRFQSLFSHK
jgi:amino acid transporter